MLKPFSFEKLGTETPVERNFRVFDEASKTIVRTDLVFTNPLTEVTVTRGIFTLYGPIVFYNIMLSVPNGDGWTVTGYIDLPYSALIDNSVFLAPHNGVVFNNTQEALMGTAYLSSTANPNRLNFSFGYTNATGATATPTIQGWYFRN
jgi:hypothetical protein